MSLSETGSTTGAAYFIDASVADGALSLGLDDGSKVFVIENNSDAFAAMDAALAGMEDVSAIHIYSHGSAGSISLGGTVYDEAALADGSSAAASLARIKEHLSADADILLYACNTGAGSLGESFVQRMARLTQADVAASDDITGSRGDWVLETVVGDVTTRPEKLEGVGSLDDDSGFGNKAANAKSDTLTGTVLGESFYDYDNTTVYANVGATGGDGNDAFYVKSDSTTVIESNNQGMDTVFVQAQKYDLSQNSNDESVADSAVEHITLLEQEGFAFQDATGNNYSQTITGNALNNTLIGKGGNDSLVGGDGNDILDGGNAELKNQGGDFADTLVGGKGDDQYIVRSAKDVVIENRNEGTDEVFSFVDYNLNDKDKANIENLTLLGDAVSATGNALNNVLKGNTEDNVLDGGAGNDTLYGDNDDTLKGGAGNDAFYVDDIKVSVDGGAGTDVIYTAQNTFGIEDVWNPTTGKLISNNIENLVYTGDDTFEGTGNALNNRIEGSATQDNVLDGGAGADTLVGGIGADKYYLDNARDMVEDAGGQDAVYATATINLSSFKNAQIENVYLENANIVNPKANNNLNATGHKDFKNNLYGNDGNNLLTGGDEDDQLYDHRSTGSLEEGNYGVTESYSGGTDKLIGGKGDDTYYVTKTSTTVTEAANAGKDKVIAFSVDHTLAANVENLTLELADKVEITGTGNDLANVIDASKVAAGKTAVLQGMANKAGEAGDTFYGGLGTNIIYSYNATDEFVLKSGEGVNNIIVVSYDVPAANGNDQFDWEGYFKDRKVDTGNVTVIYNGKPVSKTAGVDIDLNDPRLGDIPTFLSGTALSDTLIAHTTTATTINGGAGADSMVGSRNINGSKGDTFYLDNGADTIVGGVNDTVEGTTYATDTIIASANVDFTKTYTPKGGTATNLITGSIGTVVLEGTANLSVTGSNNSTVPGKYTGSETALEIIGNAGNNTLTGTKGNDTINGGAGNDSMTGGLGDDTYIIDSASDKVVELADGGKDKIVVSSDFAYSTTPLNLNLGTTYKNVEQVQVDAYGVNITGTTGKESITVNGGAIIDGKGGGDNITIVSGYNTLCYYGSDTITIGETSSNNTLILTENLGDGAAIADSLGKFSSIELSGAADTYTHTGNTAVTISGKAQTKAGEGDFITGGTGSDSIDGNGGADVLKGGGGNDRITTKFVTATGYGVSLDGGAGNDTLDFGDAADKLYLHVSNDNLTIFTSPTAKEPASTQITGFEFYTGGAGNDVIDASGMSQAINMAGGAGNDSLIGTNYGDTITADGGNDTITLGKGNDMLVFEPGDASYTTNTTITVNNFDYVYDKVNFSKFQEIDYEGNPIWNVTKTMKGADAHFVWTTTNPVNNRPVTTTIIFKNTHFGDVVEVTKVELGAEDTQWTAQSELLNTPLNIVAHASTTSITAGNENDTISGMSVGTIDGGAGRDVVNVEGAVTLDNAEGDGNLSLTAVETLNVTASGDATTVHVVSFTSDEGLTINGSGNGITYDVSGLTSGGDKLSIDGSAATNDTLKVDSGAVTLASVSGVEKLEGNESNPINVTIDSISGPMTVAGSGDSDSLAVNSGVTLGEGGLTLDSVENLTADGNVTINEDGFTGNLTVTTKNKDDIITVNYAGQEGETLAVKTGDGDNTVNLAADISKVSITGGTATDVVNAVGDVTVGTDGLTLENVEQLNVAAAPEAEAGVVVTIGADQAGMALTTSEKNDTIKVNADIKSIDGGEGTDTVNAANGISLSLAHVETLQMVKGDANTVAVTLTSVEGDLTVKGAVAEGGDNVITNTVTVDSTNPVAFGVNGVASVTGSTGANNITLTSVTGETTVELVAGDDVIDVTTLSLADASTVTLNGGDGDDTFVVDAAKLDRINIQGRDGTDTLDVHTASGSFTIGDSENEFNTADGSIETVQITSDNAANVTINSSTANLTVIGTDQNDTFTVAAGVNNLTINGGGGEDTVNAASGLTLSLTDVEQLQMQPAGEDSAGTSTVTLEAESTSGLTVTGAANADNTVHISEGVTLGVGEDALSLNNVQELSGVEIDVTVNSFVGGELNINAANIDATGWKAAEDQRLDLRGASTINAKDANQITITQGTVTVQGTVTDAASALELTIKDSNQEAVKGLQVGGGVTVTVSGSLDGGESAAASSITIHSFETMGEDKSLTVKGGDAVDTFDVTNWTAADGQSINLNGGAGADVYNISATSGGTVNVTDNSEGEDIISFTNVKAAGEEGVEAYLQGISFKLDDDTLTISELTDGGTNTAFTFSSTDFTGDVLKLTANGSTVMASVDLGSIASTFRDETNPTLVFTKNEGGIYTASADTSA